jgi:hypothetical protein
LSAGNFPAFAGLSGLTVALAPASVMALSNFSHRRDQTWFRRASIRVFTQFAGSKFASGCWPGILSFSAGLLLVAGCGQHEEIAHYTVPKPELIDPTLVSSAKPPAADTETRTLGLIIPLPGTGWFFKLTGDAAAVAKQEEAFTQFVNSLKFSEGPDPKPSWTLPDGWKDKPGSGMRYATIQVPGESKPLDLSIIPLPGSGGDGEKGSAEKYTLDNVNRWRTQLKLQPITAAELSTTTKTMKVGDHEATYVNFVGTGSGGMSSGGMSSGAPFAPFAGGALPPDHPPVGKASDSVSSGPSPGSASPGSASGAESEISYQAPPEWSAAPRNAFSLAAFKVADGDQQADITISSAGGDWAANVNRWRGQLGLPPQDAAEIATATKSIDTLGGQGQYIEITGPESAPKRETILGVRANAGGRTWFIKLKGDSPLASREQPRFEAFVKSLKLP